MPFWTVAEVMRGLCQQDLGRKFYPENNWFSFLLFWPSFQKVVMLRVPAFGANPAVSQRATTITQSHTHTEFECTHIHTIWMQTHTHCLNAHTYRIWMHTHIQSECTHRRTHTHRKHTHTHKLERPTLTDALSYALCEAAALSCRRHLTELSALWISMRHILYLWPSHRHSHLDGLKDRHSSLLGHRVANGRRRETWILLLPDHLFFSKSLLCF